MSQSKIIVVLGATGQQGSAVTSHLLSDDWQVRAFTRDPSSDRAQALARAGAELVSGDMGDRESLDAAVQGAYGVFSVQPPMWDPGDAATIEEIRLGKNAADAAKAAGVRHFVYSSNSGADRQARFRYFAKWEIEQYMKTLGLPATILRPSGFMESYASPFYGVQNGMLAEATSPDVPVQCIAVDDIGAFVALAFKHPDRFLGETIEIAGDAITPPRIAAAISRAIGREIDYVQIPIETVRQNNEIIARIYEWLNGEGYKVDFPALRGLHPGLMTFEVWLERKGRALFEELWEGNQ